VRRSQRLADENAPVAMRRRPMGTRRAHGDPGRAIDRGATRYGSNPEGLTDRVVTQRSCGHRILEITLDFK
jgi:hypothetical protein